jgi:hypothetical protein
LLGEHGLIVSLLVSEDLDELGGKFTETFAEFVVTEKLMFGSKIPIALFRQLFYFIIIYVLLEIIQFSCKNSEATDLEAIEHICEDFSIISIVIDETGHNDKIELVFVFWLDLVAGLSNDHSLQMDVSVLALCNLD